MSYLKHVMGFVCKVFGHSWVYRWDEGPLAVFECPLCKGRRTLLVVRGTGHWAQIN